MGTVATRPGERFIHSSGNAAHLVWNHLSPINTLILNTGHCCANTYPPLTHVLFSPVLTFLFWCPCNPFLPSALSSSRGTSNVPGLSVCWQEAHWQAPRPFWEELSLLHEAPRRDSVTANPLWRLGATICSPHGAGKQQRRVRSCIMLSLIDQQK